MDTLEIQTTEKVRELLHLTTVYNLAQHAKNKFKDNAEGKFNRYLTADKHGGAARFLVLFETNNKAIVMTYDEALALPTLAQKCKETWGD